MEDGAGGLVTRRWMCGGTVEMRLGRRKDGLIFFAASAFSADKASLEFAERRPTLFIDAELSTKLKSIP